MAQEHYYYFGKNLQDKMQGNALDMGNWDILRMDEVDGPFSIEKTIESYEANCMKAESYKDIAEIIVCELKNRDRLDRKIVSLGVGKGILEFHLKRICPRLVVECTDYTAGSIEQLKKVFTRMDAGYTFDIIEGDYKTLGVDSTIIMYRVSTEFNRDQWERVFRRMHEEGISNIIFVPTELATEEDMKKEAERHHNNLSRGITDVFCGWLYSEEEFIEMFGDTLYRIDERIPYKNTAVYLLTPT